MKKIKIKYLLTAFTILLLTGCLQTLTHGYSGTPRAENETAIIYINGNSIDDKDNLALSSINVDGYSLSGSLAKIAVLPGVHQINFDWRIHDESNSGYGFNLAWKKSGHCQINFHANAGQKYIVIANMWDSGTWVSDPKVRVEIRDQSSLFFPKLIKGPIDCEYQGRNLGGYLDLSK
jgi:hypothetical protein